MKIFLLSAFCFLSTPGLSQSHWSIPDFAVVQYAGSIGYFSGGFGYNVIKSKARFSTHYGFVPQNQGGQLQVLSAKLIFVPVRLTIWNRVRMNPVDLGVMASYHYGDDMETRWPEGVHPKGYYWWNPALRGHLVMESSVTYEFRKGHRFKSATGYIEFNTNELYFVSFVQNLQTVQIADVVKLGTGIRLQF